MLLGRLTDHDGPLEILRQLRSDLESHGLGFTPYPALLSSWGWERLGEEPLTPLMQYQEPTIVR